MNWDLLGAWIYRDSNVDWAKAKAHKIGIVYVDPRSGNARAAAATCRANQIVPGIYYVPNWYPGDKDPLSHAKRLSDYVQKANIIVRGEPVMVDLEPTDEPPVTPVWVAAFLVRLRQFLPTRDLAYTNCPFQNETVVPVDAVAAARCHWYVQLYEGNMAAVDAAAAMAEVCRIYDPTMVHPFYDGNALPHDARDGCVFTLERVP